MKIGVISDTHSYINPKVFPAFEGVELILHAGDIGSEDIITSLETLAPVKAIHGNWAASAKNSSTIPPMT